MNSLHNNPLIKPTLKQRISSLAKLNLLQQQPIPLNTHKNIRPLKLQPITQDSRYPSSEHPKSSLRKASKDKVSIESKIKRIRLYTEKI